MFDLLWCEFLKLKHSKITQMALTATMIVPLFAVIKDVTNYCMDTGRILSLFSFYDSAILFLMLLFGPLIITVFGVWIISREYTDGTLINLFMVPVSRSRFLFGKHLFFLLVSEAFMLVSGIEILILAMLCSIVMPVAGMDVMAVLFFLVKMAAGGILLYATMTPFIFLAVHTKGFPAPFCAVAGVILLNVILTSSPIAGLFPWSSAYLLLMGREQQLNCPKILSGGIILLVCIAGIIASMISFQYDEF